MPKIKLFSKSHDYKCSVSISYIGHVRGGLNINFKTQTTNNQNIEIFESIFAPLVTKVPKISETLFGGFLKEINIYPIGKFCLKQFEVTCGAKTNELNAKRTVVLNAETLFKAQKVNHEEKTNKLELDKEKGCVWMTDNYHSYSISAITIDRKAFTSCGNNDSVCISNNTLVYFYGNLKAWNDNLILSAGGIRFGV